MREFEWHPYPETKPEDNHEWGHLYKTPYLVTMKSTRDFTTIADWTAYKNKDGIGYRWTYCGRVHFPWGVIAWAKLPKPYEYKEEN